MKTRERLFAYAKEHNLPFRQVFGWFMSETVMSLLATSPFGRYLWLLEPLEFDVTKDLHRIDGGLQFYYQEDEKVLPRDGFVPGQQLSAEFIASFLAFLLKECEENFRSFKITGETTDYGLRLSVFYEKMYMPFSISLFPVTEQNISPREDMFTLFWKPEQRVSYYRYPVEAEVAKHVFIILTKLELLNEMEHYLYLYELLSTCSLEGKEVCMRIRDALYEEYIVADEGRLATYLSYRNYSYMKRKWKALLRRYKIKTPSWEETHDRITSFLEPLWECLKENRLFFGDWMPQLGRFLE